MERTIHPIKTEAAASDKPSAMEIHRIVVRAASLLDLVTAAASCSLYFMLASIAFTDSWKAGMTCSASSFFASSSLPWRISSRYRVRTVANAVRARLVSSKSRRSSLSETSPS